MSAALRIWTWLLTVLLLCLPNNEASISKIEPCPSNSACLIFTTDSCAGETQQQKRGYYWDAATTCKDGTYAGFIIGLEIQPSTLRKWKVVAEILENNDNLKMEQVALRFGSTEFMFLNDSAVQFTWALNERRKGSTNSMTKLETMQGGLGKINRYSFEIEAEGEKLISFFAAENIDLVREREIFLTLSDRRFAEKLEQFTKCDISEFQQPCYGSCEQISVSDSGSKLECQSKLWFQNPSEAGLTRTWHDVDQIRCKSGTWQTNGKRGNLWIHDSDEVQCSPHEPSKLTGLSMIVIGCGAGGLLLLIGGGIGGFFFYRWWQRRHPKQPSKEVLGIKVRNLRDQWAWPDEGDGTPTSKRAGLIPVEEFTAKTDFEGIKTEVFDGTERETHTNIEALHTEHGMGIGNAAPPPPAAATPHLQQNQLQDPFGAYAAAGPPLPRNFA